MGLLILMKIAIAMGLLVLTTVRNAFDEEAFQEKSSDEDEDGGAVPRTT
jgi:hypothetical protein